VASAGDGSAVYVTSSTGSAITVFDRDGATGALTQLAGAAGCTNTFGTDGCTPLGVILVAPRGLAVTPDGNHVYVASSQATGVLAFTALAPPYDVDGDGEVDPLTDGLLILRFAFDFTGATLVSGAVDQANCTRCTAAAIEAYLRALAQE
jgi:hypothetical protein